MAVSKINVHGIRAKTFTVNATTAQDGVYGGVLVLTNSQKEGAVAIIPQFARKSGKSYPLVCAIEDNAIRVQSPVSVEDVNVGVILLY